MEAWGFIRAPEFMFLFFGFVMGSLFTIMVFVIVNGIVRDTPARRVRRAERAQRRLRRAVRSAAKHGIVPRPVDPAPAPFARRVGDVGSIERSGFVQPPGPRDWTLGG